MRHFVILSTVLLTLGASCASHNVARNDASANHPSAIALVAVLERTTDLPSLASALGAIFVDTNQSAIDLVAVATICPATLPRLESNLSLLDRKTYTDKKTGGRALLISVERLRASPHLIEYRVYKEFGTVGAKECFVTVRKTNSGWKMVRFSTGSMS